MTTRATRRAEKRLVVSKASESDIGALAAALKRAETLEGFTRGYKDRLERMVMGLNMVQRALIKNDSVAAQQLIRALFSTDLKEAREAVANREQALDVAVTALQHCGHDRWASDALIKIAELAPEAAPTPTGLPS